MTNCAGRPNLSECYFYVDNISMYPIWPGLPTVPTKEKKEEPNVPENGKKDLYLCVKFTLPLDDLSCPGQT